MNLNIIQHQNPCCSCGKMISAKHRYCKYCGTEQIQIPVSPTAKSVTDHSRKISVADKSSFSPKEKQLPKFLSGSFGNTSERSSSEQNSLSFYLKNLYITDFLKNVVRTSNTGVLIYFLLNTVIITAMFNFLTSNIFEALIYSTLIYGFWMVLALSPVGEFILRFQSGCTCIKRKDQFDYLDPLFREVYTKAQKEDPSLPDNIRLYISNDSSQNAFATGRRTICITKGLLSASPEEIKAILAHEFGHISHHDTDLILTISVGGLAITIVQSIIRLSITILALIVDLFCIFLPFGFLVSICTWISETVVGLIIDLLGFFWSKLGILLTMHSSKENEYEADEFSYRLGYGYQLCTFLETITDDSMSKGLFANLVSSHPDTDLRIARLQSLGVEYSIDYTHSNRSFSS